MAILLTHTWRTGYHNKEFIGNTKNIGDVFRFREAEGILSMQSKNYRTHNQRKDSLTCYGRYTVTRAKVPAERPVLPFRQTEG